MIVFHEQRNGSRRYASRRSRQSKCSMASAISWVWCTTRYTAHHAPKNPKQIERTSVCRVMMYLHRCILGTFPIRRSNKCNNDASRYAWCFDSVLSHATQNTSSSLRNTLEKLFSLLAHTCRNKTVTNLLETMQAFIDTILDVSKHHHVSITYLKTSA